jgi:SseB protein N-terminal domain
VPVTRRGGDAGGADPAVTAALAAYAAGEATEHAALTAVAASRLLVPVVAVPVEPGALHGNSASSPPDASQRHAGEQHGAERHSAERHAGERHSGEKETEMALPTLIGNDGRKAVIAFTGTETISRWRADARPVPVTAVRLWPAVAAEQADAVVIDVAGPVPLVIEGARLAALAHGDPPPAPHEDPDVHAQVAAVTSGFTLGPGGTEAELTITLKSADQASARAVAEAIAARLAPRFRRGIAFRVS